MSSNAANTAEETPSWDRIAMALRVVLSEFELDLSKVGTSQRLQYEEFEIIFYHLFLVIDPPDTKRRFRSVCAARNPEERARFIELAVRFINDKQLSNQRVSTAQLRILGGEPFRRLLETLIKAACSSEMGRQGDSEESEIDLQQALGSSAQEQGVLLAERLREKRAELLACLDKLRESQEKLKKLRQQVKESERDNQDKWSELNRATQCINSHLEGLSLEDASGTTQSSQSTGGAGGRPINYDFGPIVRSLFARLETSHAQNKVTLEKIMAIKLPREAPELKTGESAYKKRLSQFIREAASKFDSGQEQGDPSSLVDRTRLNEQYRQRLIKYDQGVEELLNTWRQEEDRLDEEMLKEPKMLAMYKQLEELFPMMDLKPISADRNDHRDNNLTKTTNSNGSQGESNVQMLEVIKELMVMFPDERYDDKEILEIWKKIIK